MVKKLGPSRNSIDGKAWGTEPDLTDLKSPIEVAKAYNWYNYFYDGEKAKDFLETFMKDRNYPKDEIKAISKVDAKAFPNYLGWNARILTLNGKLPEDIIQRMNDAIKRLVASHITLEQKEPTSNVVNIQERTREKIDAMIAAIEGELDNFYKDNDYEFDMYEWLSVRSLKPMVANAIAEYYIPTFNELIDAIGDGPEDLKEGYRSRTEDSLILELQFIQKIIEECQRYASKQKAARKPRAKKEKSADKLVSKIKFKATDDKYKVASVRPIDIVGADQLWVFNTKYRTLGVYKSNGPNGLSVKGSTIQNFDEKESIVKTLRKPEETLKALNEAGKVQLRKLMDGIKCKPKSATGRINADTVLVRVVK